LNLLFKKALLNWFLIVNRESLKQLRRLIRINRAYQHANQGDKYLEEDKISKALDEYKKAEEYYPENPELPYWTAITLAGEGKVETALPIFKEVFAKNPKLKKMTPRLVKSGLLPDDEELLDKIMSVGE
jgi:tetratricopeptide (TPR) repeat protein